MNRDTRARPDIGRRTPTGRRADIAWTPDAVRDLVRLLAARWTLETIHALHAGPIRRYELRNALEPISDKVLTDVTCRLEQAGLVRRSASADGRPSTVFELTNLALALDAPLERFAQWDDSASVDLRVGRDGRTR